MVALDDAADLRYGRSTMLETVLALVPIFLLIVLGFVLKLTRFVPDAFWPPAEKITYFITFPALLLTSTARAPLDALAWGPLAAVSALAILVVFGGMIALRRRLAVPAPGFTSMVQGAIRPNTYIGLAAAAALFGETGVALTAVCIASVVPLVNVLAVATLVRCVGGGADGAGASAVRGIARTLWGIVSNPLILACAAGIGLNLSGIGLPQVVVAPFLEILGRAALPVGLLAVGAGLALQSLRGSGLAVMVANAAKLLGVPLAAAVLALAAGLDGPAAAVAVLYAGLPCSASSYVLARRMGGDAPMMATIITVQTLLAAGTLPVILWGAGLLFGVSP